jgi:hypothetical protein
MEHKPHRTDDPYEPPRDEQPVDTVLDALEKMTSEDEPVVWEPRLRVTLNDMGLRRGRINAALRAANARGQICHMARRVVRCDSEETMRTAVRHLAEQDDPPRRMIGELHQRIYQ